MQYWEAIADKLSAAGVMGLFQAATNQADVIPFPAKAATQSTMRIDGAASSYEGKNQSRAPC